MRSHDLFKSLARLGAYVLILLAVACSAESQDQAQGESVPERPLPVKIITLTRAPLHQWISTEGEARATRREYLAFHTVGRVNFIQARGPDELREGDPVQGPRAGHPKGDLLATLDGQNEKAALTVARARLTEALENENVAQATLERALSRVKLTTKRYERERDLLKASATSKEALEGAEIERVEAELNERVTRGQLKAARATVKAARASEAQAVLELEKTRIYSPINGIIAYKNLELGWHYEPRNIRLDSEGSALKSIPFVIIDPSHLEITVSIPSYMGGKVRQGQAVQIDRIQSLEESSLGDNQSTKTQAGQVYSVTPGIDPGERTFRVRIRTIGKGARLKDGEHVRCKILVSSKENALSIPFTATILRDRKVLVFVLNDDKRVSARFLKIGGQGGDRFEVIEGLKEGDKIVTDGRFDLYDGALVNALNEKGAKND